MYRKIAIPVDINHADSLTRAIDVGADLAKHYGATVCMIGVTGTAPSAAGKTPAEYEEKLHAFAADQAAKHGIDATALAVTAHDPTADLEDKLSDAVSALGADLVVMASHKPGMLEHVIASNAGYFASHSDLSVMVVR